MDKLLDFFTPTNYQLTLHINKHSELIQGKAIIIGQPLAQQIKFHAEQLKISAVQIGTSAQDFTLQGSRPLQFSHQNDILTLELPDISQPVHLEIKYSFKLNRNMEGAYLSTYQHAGQEQRIVTTQFESHYARQCFPCVDEPSAKATFDLKIIIPDTEDTVLSNMPVATQKTVVYDSVDANFRLGQQTTKKITVFETTPKMSTYLLAFCVGRFHHRTITNKHGIKITSYCALNQDPALLDFPGKIAAAALDYYDDLFQTPYPLQKLDQVALPDFEAGAMENWGLVTYRESCMLASAESSSDTREYVALVVAHELSHQWFGNLVTMAWWDDLWLNESFATVMEYLAVDHIHPEYQIWQNFFTSYCYSALKRDAVQGVQAVKQPVNDPAEIATLFDGAIVYAKGAHLMLMLMRLMGQTNFFAGIHDYFTAHSYQNTVGDDLWRALQPHADFNIAEFMHSWLSQPGYPVLEGDKQQRFLLDGSIDQSRWLLPKITDDMSGHYIINLSDAEFQDTLAHFQDLSLEQRIRLLLDRQLLAKTDLVSAASLIDLLEKFPSETSEAIWTILATIIGDLKIFFEPESTHAHQFKAKLDTLISEQLQRLGVVTRQDEPASDTKLRPIILALALYIEQPEVLQEIAAIYQSDYTKIPAETRYAVIAANFKLQSEANFDQLLADYQKISDPELKSDLLSIICLAKQPTHTEQLLKLLHEPAIVRPQDHLSCLSYLLRNYKTKAQAIDWLYQNWLYVEQLSGEKTLGDYIQVLASQIRSAADFQAFQHFFAPFRQNPALKRAIQTAEADITARLALIQSDQSAVLARLSRD